MTVQKTNRKHEMHVPFFTNSFFSKDLNEYKLDDVKEIGFVIDWFSNVFERTILVGHIVYETKKNYRCKSEYEKYKEENATIKKTVIFIHKSNKHSILKFKTIENLFVNKLDEVNGIENKILCNFNVPRIKSNGKPAKLYKIERKKRFTIPVDDVMITDGCRLLKSTVISCTFRNLE